MNRVSRERKPEAQRELQALVDAAVDAIIVIDHRGLIEIYNPAAERLFGYSAAEAIGNNVSMLMPEPDRSAHDGYIARYLATGEPHVIGRGREVSARRKDGTLFPAMLAVGRIGTDPPRFAGFVHDITERKRMETEALAAQERLNRFDRLSIMGEMASGLAHEVNQPLAAISNYSQAARRLLESCSGENVADIADALEQIGEQALRAGDIISWLRSFARGHDGRREILDCNLVIEELLPLVQLRTRRHGVRMVLDLAPTLAAVMANALELQQVLLNLVHNAIDAMSTHAGPKRELTLRTRAAENGIEIAVLDTGPGLSEPALERLFSPFFTTKAQGTGLGLAISQSLVRSHGGVLRHEPNPGGGACFHLSLPVQAESPE